MVVPYITYIILRLVFLGAAAGLSLFLEKRKMMKFPGILIFLAIGLFIFSSQVFPFVYTITGCGVYKKEVLIIPKIVNETKMTLGKKAWINNASDYYLYIEAIVYGYSSKNPNDQEIEPHTCVQAKAYKLSYIFEEPPQRIRTKNSSETRYWLDCQYEYYDEEEFDEYDNETST